MVSVHQDGLYRNQFHIMYHTESHVILNRPCLNKIPCKETSVVLSLKQDETANKDLLLSPLVLYLSREHDKG